MEPLTPEEMRSAAITAFRAFQQDKQDLGSYIIMGRTVIDACLALAELHADQSAAYKAVALPVSYNIAAGCWPGWEDADPNLTKDQRELGLELARFNVAIGKELDIPPERKKNGAWILGVHLLACKQWDEAKASLARAADFSEQAGLPDAAEMSRGWIHVSDILAGDASKRSSLDQVIELLKGMGEDGEFYAGQYQPAIQKLS